MGAAKDKSNTVIAYMRTRLAKEPSALSLLCVLSGPRMCLNLSCMERTWRGSESEAICILLGCVDVTETVFYVLEYMC